MSEAQPNGEKSPFYRVDKFSVPEAGRAEFLEQVAAVHALLRTQKGFVRDLIMEQESGPGTFNFVTLVEWTGPEVVEYVAPVVAEFHKRTGFNREAFLAKHGIKADIANYRRLDV